VISSAAKAVFTSGALRSAVRALARRDLAARADDKRLRVTPPQSDGMPFPEFA